MTSFLHFVGIVLILSIVSFFVCRAGYRRQTVVAEGVSKMKDNPACRDIIYSVLVVVVCFSLLAALLKQSWVQGDEWHFVGIGKLSLRAAIKYSFFHYLRWVSRVGEICAGIIGLSPSRWQEWVFVPLFSSFAPMALFALVRKKGDTFFSEKGRLFYVTSFVLFLLAVYLPSWRNYWCYAAAWNYLFPSVVLIYFLSFFRKDANHKRSALGCSFLFLMGLISGWGMECTTVVGLPILTCVILYNLVGKKTWLPFSSYCGYCGYLWGAAALFCSPALYARSMFESGSNMLDISHLSIADYQNFIHHLDWDKVEMLRGASGIVTLKEIPIWDRIYFLPFVAEVFLSCAGVVLFFWILISLTLFLRGKKGERFHPFMCSLAVVAVAILLAFSYSVQCIPTEMSFLPAGFAVVAACMYIFIRFCRRGALYACSILILLTGGIVFLPAGIQAAQYKCLDVRRFDEISQAKHAGVEEVTLTAPSVTLWYPTLGLIAVQDIKDDEKSYPNGVCAFATGIQELRQPKAVVRKNPDVPLSIFPKLDRKLFEGKEDKE